MRLPVKMSADNGDFLCQAAIAGLGVTVLPTFIASEAIKSGQLVCLLEDYKLPLTQCLRHLPSNQTFVSPRSRIDRFFS